jgi:CheY-like chemotaxis protein
MKRTRVLIADDHILILEAFKRLLEPEFDVVGTVADGRAPVTGGGQIDEGARSDSRHYSPHCRFSQIQIDGTTAS